MRAIRNSAFFIIINSLFLILPSLASAAPANTITITDKSGTASSNYPFQFGRPFVQGEIHNFPQVLINGVAAPTQADVKNRYPDGSVKFAVIAAVLPSIPANGTVTVSFQNQSSGNNTPLTSVQMLDTSYNFDAKMNFTSTTTGATATAVARTMLQNGDYKLWTSGQIAQTVEIADDSLAAKYDLGLGDGYHPIRPRFYATFWPATHQVFVRYVGELSNTLQLENVTADVALTLGNSAPQTVFTQPAVIMLAASRWTKTYWQGATPEQKININYNLGFLKETYFVPSYDPSVSLSDSNIQNDYVPYWSTPNPWYTKAGTLLYDHGYWGSYMPGAGGRQELAPYPLYYVKWLITGDWRERNIALVSADLAGAWPVNYREADPSKNLLTTDTPGSGTGFGKPLSVANHQSMTMSSLGNKYTNFDDRVRFVQSPDLWSVVPSHISTKSNEWNPDGEHQPDPYSLPYILTGDPYYLEQMQFLASWTADFAQRGPNRDEGDLYETTGRFMGWTLRNRTQTAFLTPDGDPLKTYFNKLTNDAIAYWEGMYDITGTPNYMTKNWKYGNSLGNPFQYRANVNYGILDYPNNPLHASNFQKQYNVNGTYSYTTIGQNLGAATWMQDIFIYGLARAGELGFSTQALLNWNMPYLYGQIFTPGVDPFIVDNFGTTVGPDWTHWAHSWTEVFSYIDPVNYPAIDAARSVGDPIFGYAPLFVMGAASLGSVPGGSNLWNWAYTNLGSRVSYSTAPGLNIVPRTLNTAPYVPPSDPAPLKPVVILYYAHNNNSTGGTPTSTSDYYSLFWYSRGMTTCTGAGFATGGKTNGSVAMHLSKSTSYAITCSGPDGSDTDTQTIPVDNSIAPPVQPPAVPPTSTSTAPTATLSANPTSITAGQSSTLSWSSTNATSCTGVGFTASATTGSVTVSPTATQTYSITCAGAGGTSPVASATVTVSTITPNNTLQNISLTGAGFTQTNTCTGAIANGSSCTFNVTFTPTSAAAFTGTLSFLDTTTNTTKSITLSGTGVSGTTSTTPPPPPPPPPPSGTIVVSNVHNAPGWLPNHAYSPASGPKTRVNNGAGWSPASGTYNPGQTLAAYELTSGSCTSGTTGPTGTGSSISDGSCTWKYLSPTDYLSITGWSFDDAPWTANASYYYQDYVTSGSPLRAYRAEAPCVSGGTPPSGTGIAIADGTCKWDYKATINYSSKVSYIPKQKYFGGSGQQATIQMAANYTAALWNDREYVNGQNGELDPIVLQAHLDWTNDNVSSETQPKCANTSYVVPNCIGGTAAPMLTLQAAPGEGFRDNPNAQTSALAYNPANGVAIRSMSAHVTREMGAALNNLDSEVTYTGLQFKSDNWIAIDGQVHGNNMFMHGVIADSNGPFGVYTDGGSEIDNSLIINRSTTAGSVGVAMAYIGALINNTVVHPGTPATNGTCAVMYSTAFGKTPTWRNNACFGFPNGQAVGQTGVANFSGSASSNNATDAAGSSAGTAFTVPSVNWIVVPMALAGSNTLFNLNAANEFVNPSSDWRELSTAHLRGAGVAAAPYNATDIVGTSRSGSYDIGAWQSTGAVLGARTSLFDSLVSMVSTLKQRLLALLNPASQMAAVTLSQTALDFGQITVGQTSTKTFTITITSGTIPTATLSANPTSITAGQSSTLSWSSTNATSCTGVGFTASATTGSVTVSPTATQTYSITCAGAGGTSPVASATVTVSTITPNNTLQNISLTGAGFTQTNTCTGAIANGSSCTFNVTFTPTSAAAFTGTLSFLDTTTNTTKSITLSGTGVSGTTNTPTATLSASPTSIASGASATLAWSSTNATSCTGVGFTASATTGSVTVSPTATQTYSITCSGTGGTSPTASATVSVGTTNPAPTPTNAKYVFNSNPSVSDASLAIPNNVLTVVSNINNAPAWQASHAYAAGDTVVNGSSPLRGYRAVTAGTSGSSGGPSGSGSSIQDGGVTWRYLSDVDFRSITAWISSIPHETTTGSCNYQYNMAASYVGELWNGKEYLDDNPNSAIDFSSINGAFSGCGERLGINGSIDSTHYQVILTAAPGESFADRGPNIPMAYNPKNGVAIRSSFTTARYDNSVIWATGNLRISRLQIKGDHLNGIGAPNAVIDDNLIDAGQSALQLDYYAEAHNDIIISRGKVAVTSTYNNLIDHVTIVNPAGTGVIGIQVGNPGLAGPPTVRNSAIFGFKYPAASQSTYPPFSMMSDNNATDVANDASQNGTAISLPTPTESNRIYANSHSVPLPGPHSLFSVPFSGATFVDPTSDYRLAPASQLISAGALGSPLSFKADASTITYPFLLQNARNFSTTVPLLPVSNPALYYGVSAANTLFYPDMLVSGPGLPSGNIAQVVWLNNFITGHNEVDAYLSQNVTQNQAGATFTASYDAMDGSDIVGTARSSPDIGAWESTGTVLGAQTSIFDPLTSLISSLKQRLLALLTPNSQLAAVALSQTSLDFGPVTVGQSSAKTLTVTITTGNTPTPIATLTASPTSITTGQSATLSWSSTNATLCTGSGFTANGTSGSVSVTPSVTTTYSVTCMGTGGTSPAASATVTVSTITPTNTLSNISLTGAGFTQTNTCTGAIANGSSCAFSITFTPTSASAFTGNLSFLDTTTNTTKTITLSGTGVAPVATTTPPTPTPDPTPIPTPTPTPDLSQGLVGHWTFDDKDLIRNVADTSGLGNNGYWKIGATTTVPGIIGQALSFDGVSNYVSVPTNSSLEEATTTITVWFKPNSSSAAGSLVGAPGSGTPTTNSSLYVTFTSGTTKLNGIANTNGSGPTFSLTYPFNAGTWYFVAMTVATGEYRAYVNGVLVKQGDPGTLVDASNNPIVIGANIGGVNSWYPGSIDDVRIYNRPLSAAEVQQLYTAGSAGQVAVLGSPQVAAAAHSNILSMFADLLASLRSRLVTLLNPAGQSPLGGASQMAAVTLSQTALDFGTVTVGQSLAKTLTVTVGTTPPPSPSTIQIGSRVKTTVNLNVRAKPNTKSGKIICVQALGALGTVISGPATNQGYQWWQVNYDTSCDGWSAVDGGYLVTTN